MEKRIHKRCITFNAFSFCSFCGCAGTAFCGMRSKGAGSRDLRMDITAKFADSWCRSLLLRGFLWSCRSFVQNFYRRSCCGRSLIGSATTQTYALGSKANFMKNLIFDGSTPWEGQTKKWKWLVAMAILVRGSQDWQTLFFQHALSMNPGELLRRAE